MLLKRRTSTALIVILLTIFFPLSKTYAAPFSINTTFWDKYTNADGTGLYFDILTSVYGKDKYTYTLEPWKRAQSSFVAGKGDSLLGEGPEMEYCHYSKWPVDADFYSAFYLKSKISSLPSSTKFNPYKVIWVRGYAIDTIVKGLKPFAEVDNIEQGIKMIIAGRADILIDYEADMKDYLTGKKLVSAENIVSSTDISGGFIYLCFRKGDAMNSNVKLFDDKMETLFKTGALAKIFAKYNRTKNYTQMIKFQK